MTNGHNPDTCTDRGCKFCFPLRYGRGTAEVIEPTIKDVEAVLQYFAPPIEYDETEYEEKRT